MPWRGCVAHSRSRGACRHRPREPARRRGLLRPLLCRRPRQHSRPPASRRLGRRVQRRQRPALIRNLPTPPRTSTWRTCARTGPSTDRTSPPCVERPRNRAASDVSRATATQGNGARSPRVRSIGRAPHGTRTPRSGPRPPGPSISRRLPQSRRDLMSRLPVHQWRRRWCGGPTRPHRSCVIRSCVALSTRRRRCPIVTARCPGPLHHWVARQRATSRPSRRHRPIHPDEGRCRDRRPSAAFPTSPHPTAPHPTAPHPTAPHPTPARHTPQPTSTHPTSGHRTRAHRCTTDPCLGHCPNCVPRRMLPYPRLTGRVRRLRRSRPWRDSSRGPVWTTCRRRGTRPPRHRSDTCPAPLSSARSQRATPRFTRSDALSRPPRPVTIALDRPTLSLCGQQRWSCRRLRDAPRPRSNAPPAGP
jgi:hypothetical protein